MRKPRRACHSGCDTATDSWSPSADVTYCCCAATIEGGGSRCAFSANGSQRPREAELVAVEIGEVKVSLAPFGVARRRRRLPSGRQRALVERVDVSDIKDDASPPGPVFVGLHRQIEITRARTKAREGC